MPDEQAISRREMLIKGSAAVAGVALLPSSLFANFLSLEEEEQVIPWSDPPPAPPAPDMNLLNWEQQDSWITPADKLFRASHYGMPAISTRAIDTAGNIQPAADDPSLLRKRTYWESNGQFTRKVRI